MCICDCIVNVWWVCGDGAHRKTSKTLCFVIVYLMLTFFFLVLLFWFAFCVLFSIYCRCLVTIFMLPAHSCSHIMCSRYFLFLSIIQELDWYSFFLFLFGSLACSFVLFGIVTFSVFQRSEVFKLIFISCLNKIFGSLKVFVYPNANLFTSCLLLHDRCSFFGYIW